MSGEGPARVRRWRLGQRQPLPAGRPSPHVSRKGQALANQGIGFVVCDGEVCRGKARTPSWRQPLPRRVTKSEVQVEITKSEAQVHSQNQTWRLRLPSLESVWIQMRLNCAQEWFVLLAFSVFFRGKTQIQAQEHSHRRTGVVARM